MDKKAIAVPNKYPCSTNKELIPNDGFERSYLEFLRLCKEGVYKTDQTCDEVDNE